MPGCHTFEEASICSVVHSAEAARGFSGALSDKNLLQAILMLPLLRLNVSRVSVLRVA